jgi:hypothetical protein
MMRCRPQGYLLLVLLLVLALCAGCGNKGPVRPQRQPLPAAPEDLVLRQQGTQMLLSWMMPQLNQDGTDLTDLAGFKVMRMDYDPAEDCPDCRDTSILLRQVELDYLRDVQRMDGRMFLADPDLEEGRGYQYRIIPYNRWGQDGTPVTHKEVISAIPPAPESVQAESSDGVLTLTWQAPKTLPGDMELLGYNVYRRRPGRPFAIAPLNPTPVTGTRFEDRAFKSGSTYLYAVRAVVRQQQREVESRLSKAVIATPWAGNQASF